MRCTIDWNKLKLSEWDQRFKRLKRSSLLQCYPYAQSVAAIDKQRPRWGLIKIDGIEAGLVQIFEAGILANIIHAVILDRGPLWFDGFDTKENIEAFFSAFNKQFPRRIGRKRRIIPETDIDLKPLGYQALGGHYQTIWLDINQGEDVLRANLKKSWRGVLQKAEDSALTMEWDSKGDHLDWLIQNYAVDKETKGYDGPSVKLLRQLTKHCIPRGECIIGRALINGKPVAGILILCHGSAATYQIGFTSADGRDNGAHHLLLWQAIGVLKFKKIKDFDLGGINDETAKGVKKFKEGMGGEISTTGGMHT